MKKKILFGTLIWMLYIGSVSASIVFDFSGTCEIDCSRFGLIDGESFNETNVLAFYDGTDTSAGAALYISDIEYFTFFGIDFLSGNSFFDPSNISTFSADNVLGGFILTGGTNTFCYDYQDTYCDGGRFDTIVGSNLEASGNLGHGPAQFIISSVPVPPAIWLLSSGLFALLTFSRKYKQDSHTLKNKI